MYFKHLNFFKLKQYKKSIWDRNILLFVEVAVFFGWLIGTIPAGIIL